MEGIGFLVLIIGGVIGLLVAMTIYVGIQPSAADPMQSCLLYQKTLMGDDKETHHAGKTTYTVTVHYYNTTYICDQHFTSRVEKAD